MTKVYMQCGGGLGDCLNTFFTGSPAYAQSIKEVDPTAFIHLLCCSSNKSIGDAVHLNPLFDEVSVVSTLDNIPATTIQSLEDDGFRCWTQVFEPHTLQKHPQQIYLTPEETIEVQKIRDLGPYVVMHPFNSAGTGISATHFEHNTNYRLIIQQALDAGYYVVQVGGNWTHIPTCNVQKEEFAFNHPKFIDLVNKFNIRMIAKTVIGADKFIGTSSVWVVVATVNGVPSFMILPEHMKDILREEQQTGQGLRGTMIHKYGLFSGAALPELYALTNEFLTGTQPRKVPYFDADAVFGLKDA